MRITGTREPIIERLQTNLAAEFRVLSVPHSFRTEANLTLGNKKSGKIVIFMMLAIQPQSISKGSPGCQASSSSTLWVERERSYRSRRCAQVQSTSAMADSNTLNNSHFYVCIR